WPRRVAQLAPHLLPGEFHRDQVAVEFATAAVLVDRGRPNEAEDALRRAEAAAGPHVLTPERELRVVRAITDHAAGYASTGTPGRYIAESHVEGGTTWREWDWIEAYIAAHPEVLATGLPDHKKIRAREAEELAVAQDAGKRFDLEAKHAFKRGDYAKALDLIDTGEIVYPDPQRGWRLRRQRAEDALARREGREPAEDALAEPGEHADDRETAAPAPQIPPTDGPALHAAVNAAAAAWFDRQLDEHAAAQEFLRSRLGGREPVDRVRARDGDDRGKLTIGYAPDRWDGLCSHLLGEGFAEQDLIDAGVAIRAKTGNLVDLFRHRIVFAVRDEQGRIAGFTGRTLHSDDILERDERTPKYLNTRNTDLFVKSRLLLGLHEQRDLAGHASPVFVEGPFDVAALMALAPPERPMMFLATCGTALTDSHLAAVDALVPVERPRVYGGDNDAAGRTALAGQIETALVRYPHADALVLPEGRDPAEWAVQAVHDAPDGGFRGSPPTRWAMEALVDLRIAPYADRLGEDYEVEASIKAARDAAAALALVEPERTAELEAALVARLHIDPVHLAEFVGDARQARDRTRPRQPAAAAAPASAASGPAAPDGAEDRADPVVQDESTAADRPGSPADPGPDIPDPHQHDEDTAMDDRPEPVGDGPWLLDPVARRLDEQTPLSRLDRTENAADVYDALAASVTGDALDRLTESGGHEALDLLLQADRLEAIAQAAERAQHAPVILVKGDTEQRLDPDRIDGAFALLAQRPGERLALRCGDLTFRCGTDRAGTYIAIEPAVWRSDDEQPWADRARLSAAATRPDAAGQAREQVQDRIGTARARATLARGRLTAVLAGRGLSDGALARAGLADNADRLGTQQVQRIGAQLARVDLLRQFAVAGALPASGDEFTFGGEPLADPGPALAEVSPFPQDPHHSEVLRWRGLEVSTRWTDEQEKPFLCLAVAPAGHSGSDRRPPLMFEMTPEWFTDTGYAPDRIVEFVRRTVANAERIALRELQAAQEAIGAPEREDRERAEAAAERTAAAEEQTAAAREHAAAHHTLVIEHNASGTLVHGSSKDDTALHKLLHTHKFKFSKRQEFWFLPRPWHFDTRSVHARLLARDLRAAGRAHEMWDNEIAAPETPPPPLPEAEPFTTRKQFTDAERAATSAYWAVHETASGRRLLGFGNGRPDAEALRTARDEISQHRFQGDPAQSLDRYVALYRAAKILYDNLVAERKNAPKMMDRLKLLVERSGRFAAGLRALIEQNPGSGLIADVTTGHEAAAEETVAVAPSPEPEQAQLDMFATAGAETADDERRGEDIAAPAETPADTDTPAEPEASAGDPRGEDDAPEREARDALPELTARQKADLRGTYSGLHDLLTAASFTHVQEPGIGVPGAIDVEARTATTDPDLPPEEKIRCLVMQTDKMRLHRARLAEQARTALAAAEPDEATAARAGELASLASQLDTLAETAAGAKRAERRWVVPTHSFVSHQLNDGEVETALHGFARAAQQGISPAEALKGKQIVVGPRSTGLTWHTLNLEFSRNDDNGVVLSIATADRRNRDEVAVDPRWLDIESGGAQIRSAFEQRVAGLGARADAARLEMLALLAADTAAAHEGPVDTAARLADTAPADATTATEPTPEPEPSPEPAAESAAEPEHEAGDAPAAAASAQPPEAGPSTAVHDDQDSRLTLAEEALGGGKPDLDAVLGHWQGMPNPHPDDPASAETWDYDRDRLINEVRGARKTQLSPGGVLLAYKRNQRTPLWTVVQTSTGHPVIDTAAVAIPPHSAPRPSTRYTVLGLPDVAGARGSWPPLERGPGTPTDTGSKWKNHASMTRTAAQWRMPGLNGTVVSGDDAAGVGLRHLLAAALLDAAALHPQAVCGSPAFNRALYAALPDENALWGTRIPGDLAEDFRDVATQFSAEGPALQNPRQQHRKLRKRKQDDRTYAVVRLAATLAFTGRPHAAVQLLQNRADELEPSDETRHFLYGSYRLRHLVRGIEELFSPVDTELERLLSATPGDRVVATASKGGPGIGSVWIVTGPSRRTTIPSTGNWQVEMRVDLMHDSGPVHAALHIAPGERSRRVWFDYDHSQPDNSADRVWSDDQLYHASADNWAFVPAGEQLPDTAADLEALTRRAATAFADGTSRPDHAVADPSEADAEQNGTEAGEKVPASAAVADEEPAPVLSSVDSSGARGDAPESTAEPEAPRAEQPREHTDNAPPADIESISAPGKEPARPQDELDSLTRRAATPFADGTPGPDPAAAEQPGDHAEQTRSDADGNNSAPAATDDEEPAPPLPSADSAGAPADAAGDGAEPARAKARALIEGIDAEFLAAAEQELDESQTGESALELLVTGLDLHNPRLVPPPVAEEIELAVHNVTRGTGFDPDFRAQLAIRRGRGAEDAAWLAALADGFSARRGPDDPLGRVLARTGIDKAASDLHDMVELMGIYGNFAVPGRPAPDGGPAQPDTGPGNSASAEAAAEELESARAHARALLEGIDDKTLATAARLAGDKLDLLLRALGDGPAAVMDKPVASVVVDVVGSVADDIGFDPDRRARQAVESGLGVAAATAITAFADALADRSGRDDPLGRVLPRIRADDLVSGLHAVADRMGVHGGFAVPGRPVSAPEDTAEQDRGDRGLDQDAEPGFDTEYDEAGFAFVPGVTNIGELFLAHGWVLQEELPSEIGGMRNEHWYRHDVSVAVGITPDERVLTTVARRHGPWDSPDWQEAEFTSGQKLRDLVEQAGLHGVARPARLPGLWRVENADYADEARAAVEADAEARLVTRAADAAQPAWSFADDGQGVPLAPPLPEVPVTDRNSLLRYILGERYDEKETRNLASIVISGRARNGTQPVAALQQLREIDAEVYRRAFAATAGFRTGKKLDVARAREALVRLAEGDPALPLNAAGQYAEITHDNEPQAPDSDGWIPVDRPRPVRGLVADLRPDTSLGRVSVLIDRDVVSADGAPRALQVLDVDGRVSLLDPATRPSPEERATASAAMQESIEARKRALGIGDHTAPPTAAEPAAAAETPVAEEPAAEDAGAARDAGPVQEQETAAADPDVPVLRLPDGRELTHLPDPGRAELPLYAAIAREAYQRTEPGRFRLIVAREADGGRSWWWALHRIDADGAIAGIGIRPRTSMHATAERALAAAQRRLAPLEQALETPVEPVPGLSGPFASVTFVPEWGDVAGQLEHMEWPDAVRSHRPASVATTIVRRMFLSVSPEENARWLLGDGYSPESAAEVSRQLRELAAVIRASGLPDAVPGTHRRISGELAATGAAITARLEQTAPPPAAAEAIGEDIPLPPEPEDREDANLPPDLAELDVEPVFLDLDRWRHHDRPDSEGSGVPEPAARAHNHLIDLLTPATVAALEDRSRRLIAHQVQDSYRYDLLAAAVRRAGRSQQLYRTGSDDRGFLRRSSDDLEAWDSVMEALGADPDSYGQVSWGQIRFTVERGRGRTVAVIAVADLDSGYVDVIDRIPYVAGESGSDRLDRIGHVLRVATEGASSRAVLARGFATESLDAYRRSAREAASARLEALPGVLPSSAGERRNEIYYELQDIKRAREAVLTLARGRLDALEFGGPADDADAFEEYPGERPVSDPGAVLATPEVRDTPGAESTNIFWRGFLVYTSHSHDGRLELVLCESHGLPSSLLSIPLTAEQFTPEGVLAALHDTMATLEQTVLDRTVAATAAVADLEAETRAAPGNDAGPHAEAAAAPDPAPAEPAAAPGDQPPPTRSGAPSAPADVEDAEQPGLFDLAPPP
ncbi:hypothetical protein, partial [Streptomyces sp. AA4]|uniref:hypothetical protein n=1 Tax=Streptomyces sp. AA4 TaxID=591158 RepID=UPI0001B54C2A